MSRLSAALGVESRESRVEKEKEIEKEIEKDEQKKDERVYEEEYITVAMQVQKNDDEKSGQNVLS